MTSEELVSSRPRCSVCSNEKWKAVYRIRDWSVLECTSCGFARIDPLPSRDSRPELYSEDKVVGRNTRRKSAVKRFFAYLKRVFGRLFRRNKGAIFYNRFCKRLPAGSAILDIGCGDGSFLRMAKERFVCTGIEISPYLAGLARMQNDIKVIEGDFLTDGVVKRRFDGISLISLLEHLDDPMKAVSICFNLMNKGGVILLKTVNYSSINRVVRGRGWTGFRPPDHVVYFSPANLTRLLKKAGFAKVSISAWPLSDNMYCEAVK